MPVHQGFGRRQHRRLVLRHKAAHRDRPQVDELQVFATRNDQNAPVQKTVAGVRTLFDGFVSQERYEDWCAVGREAQERFDLRPAKGLDFVHR